MTMDTIILSSQHFPSPQASILYFHFVPKIKNINLKQWVLASNYFMILIYIEFDDYNDDVYDDIDTDVYN